MSIVWTGWERYKEGKDEYSMNRMRRIWRRKGWVGWEGYEEERMSIVWTGWEGYEGGKDEYSMNR